MRIVVKGIEKKKNKNKWRSYSGDNNNVTCLVRRSQIERRYHFQNISFSFSIVLSFYRNTAELLYASVHMRFTSTRKDADNDRRVRRT